jgi:hypothetical protein
MVLYALLEIKGAKIGTEGIEIICSPCLKWYISQLGMVGTLSHCKLCRMVVPYHCFGFLKEDHDQIQRWRTMDIQSDPNNFFSTFLFLLACKSDDLLMEWR